jgi:hypothetical protein
MWADMAHPAETHLNLFIANMPKTSTAIPTSIFVKS